MILDIVYYGNPLLRKKTKPVRHFDPVLQKLCNNMIETMKNSNGIGLAAPQIGENKQIFIADISPEEEDKVTPIIAINPILIPVEKEKEDILKEGCLSIPGLYAQVKRYHKVLLKAVDEHNVPFEFPAEGLIARIFQHEFDHLQGILFTDKVLAMEKKEVDLFLKNFRKENA